MKISIEHIVEIITKEVVKELLKKGIRVNGELVNDSKMAAKCAVCEVDMKGFKTPILFEGSFDDITPETSELLLPKNTIITPGAHDIIKRNKIKISYK